MKAHGHDPKPEALTISVEEAAALLGIGRTLGYELVRRGELPAIALGGRWVVPKGAIDRMLQDSISETLEARTRSVGAIARREDRTADHLRA